MVMTDSQLHTFAAVVSQGLPEKTTIGEAYPVVFSFANTSPTALTEVVAVGNYPAAFTEVANSATATSESGSSFQVVGNFVPTEEGAYTVKVTVKFAEGDAVTASTSTLTTTD